MEETSIMTLNKIKREFVAYMEETRQGDPYPRNFMGCLIAILIEPEPISQERIMEQTGYSQATISLTLQKLQLLLPIKTVKVRGDRKKYYSYDGSAESFILDLWKKRLEEQDNDIIQIETSLDEVRRSAKDRKPIRRFLNYLLNMQLYTTLIHSLRATSIQQYEQMVETGFVDNMETKDSNFLELSEVENFLEELKRKQAVKDSPIEPEPEYLEMKNHYFTGLKTNLNPLYSQAIANQMMVLHDVFIEQITSQERIEQSTLLPRSTISELLSEFARLGIIRAMKKEGTRIKLYQPAISFTDYMLGYSERLGRQMVTAKVKLSEFISVTCKTNSSSIETKHFLQILESFLKAYSFTEDFTKTFKIAIVTKLKQAYDRGFVFI